MLISTMVACKSNMMIISRGSIKPGLQNGESEACSQLKSLVDDLTKDLEFIHSGNFFACIYKSRAYSEKLQLDRQKEKELITLSWKVKELGDLNETGRCLHSKVIPLSNSIQQGIGR